MSATRSLTSFLLQVVFGAWFMASQPKTKFVIYIGSVGPFTLVPFTFTLRVGGPDWARTSDPALIKRML